MSGSASNLGSASQISALICCASLSYLCARRAGTGEYRVRDFGGKWINCSEGLLAL